MNLEELTQFCTNLKGATFDFPFDETTMVFRIGGKMFCLADTEDIPFRFNLKCDPEYAIELRERYETITPGYHCNKKHWNTIEPNARIKRELIYELIEHSYKLVYNSLKKSQKEEIEKLN